MKAFAIAIMAALGAASAAAQSSSAEQEAGMLFGVEYIESARGQPLLPNQNSCIDEGGQALQLNGASQELWAAGIAFCQGRRVELLKRAVGSEDGRTRWRIEDVLLLPQLESAPDADHPTKLTVETAGICTLSGRADTSFLALVRWGARQRIDHRDGVLQVWGYDIRRGRIVQRRAKALVCERGEEA
jgi:hypothetical protein